MRFIYYRYFAGDSLDSIARKLYSLNILTPAGKRKWKSSMVRSILTNEKYKGDLVINKTFVADCISKKVCVNNGERKKYYVKNSHPAIVDERTFARVQEEIARRAGKPKVKSVGTKTELGKYSGKYALSEILICGECKTPYRRCVWSVRGQKKQVWRCINRLDYGKKYCHHSPTIAENLLHESIMEAIKEVAQGFPNVLQTLKKHILMGLDISESVDDATVIDQERVAILRRLSVIDESFNKMIETVTFETESNYDENKIAELVEERNYLQDKLQKLMAKPDNQAVINSRMAKINSVIDVIKNHPLKYDDEIVRGLIECIVVESKEQIEIIFKGGMKVEQTLYANDGAINLMLRE